MNFAAKYIYWQRILLGLLVVAALAAQARAAPYADIVMDMRDGTVLHATNADRRQHPASLTKMMTLYLTFEAVRAGQLSLDQTVRVSQHAASQPSSKLYLKSGERVTIRSLIRAAAIKSANDAAVVLAEAVGGTEPAFARMMTSRARQLGMKNTTFRNANGLTAEGQLTTARDMAILGRRLFFDFPEYYGVFSRTSEYAAGRRITSTNRLLSSYEGADGIKTGYTVAAGYNLVASARRGNKQLVATVLGAPSGRWRNDRMAELLDKGFAKARSNTRTVEPETPRDLIAGVDAPTPSQRPQTTPTGLAALGELVYSEADASVLPTAPVPQVTAARPVSPAAGGTKRAPLRAELAPVRPGTRAKPGKAVEPAKVATLPGGKVVPHPPQRPRWAVQLGAFDNRDQAVASVAAVTLGSLDMLAAAEPQIDEVKGRSGKLYRVRFTGLEPQDASRACVALKAHGRDCITVAPGR